jgi:hypothetical protein
MSELGQKRKGSDRANVFRSSTESRLGPARLAYALRASSGKRIWHLGQSQRRAAAMYILAAGIKQDPLRRWSLPDRVFFACGACHILAYAFLKAYPEAGFAPIWIKPAPGYTGNHIVAVRNDLAFDYHGYSNCVRLLKHTASKANRWWPGWSAQLISLPKDVLISEPKSLTYEGLHLREPRQFLHDAMPRAERFLRRFQRPPE